MGIKSTGVIRLHNNMDSKELDQNITKIKGFKGSGSDMLRARVTNFGRNKVTIFDVYKSTFSDRSLIKLEKLKNIILNKNLSTNEMLTKGIIEGQSIKINKFEFFIKDKKEFVEHVESSPHNSSLSADQMFPQEKIDNVLENYRAQTQSSNTKELKPIIQDDDLMKMLEIIEDDKMSVQDFQSEFKKQTQNINPKSIAGTTIDTELKKLEDEYYLHDISLNDLNNEEKITEQTQKNNPQEKGINLQILDDEPMLMGISDENELISHSAVEITTSDIGPPPPKDNVGPPPAKVDPKVAKRQEDVDRLQATLRDLGLF